MLHEKCGSKVLVVLTLVLAAMFLVYDLWVVLNGLTNLNQYVPFFYPVVLSAFAAALWWIDTRFKALTPEEQARLVADAMRQSGCNPANTRRHKGIE